MAYIDYQLQLADSQAISTVGANVSTNIIDLSKKRPGKGEPLAIVIFIEVALAGTSPTAQFQPQTADNSGFSGAVSLGTSQSFTSLPAGTRIVLPLPSDERTEAFLRLNTTLGGTTPTLTYSAYVTPMDMITSIGVFPDAMTISG